MMDADGDSVMDDDTAGPQAPEVTALVPRRQQIANQVQEGVNRQGNPRPEPDLRDLDSEMTTAMDLAGAANMGSSPLIDLTGNKRTVRPQTAIMVDNPGEGWPGPAPEEGDWTRVRSSQMVRRVTSDVAARRKGWRNGENEERWFMDQYRKDRGQLPWGRGKYNTPENSKVSDAPFWRSGAWLRKDPTLSRFTARVRAAGERPVTRVMKALIEERRRQADDNAFLQNTGPLQVMGDSWKGVKVLGKGGGGIVGLWEYVGPGEHPWGDKIVVKKTLNHSLNEEAAFMILLGQGGKEVPHAMRLLHPTTVPTNSPLVRMILEFCEGGDVDSLIIKHREERSPFTEKTLWLMFECFAKGLNLLDHGDEKPERTESSRNPMCHFDIKPQNILRGRVGGDHINIPINKIADLGLATLIDPVKYKAVWRARGTKGYLAPEQFSQRWSFGDVQRTGHVNVYGTHTNIWQIGVVMYMLATLRGPPRPKGFRARAIGKKFTYGYKLIHTKYSRTLKSLIWRCLCDKPKERPSLVELHSAINGALAAFRVAPVAAEPVQELEPLPSQPPTTTGAAPGDEMEVDNAEEATGGQEAGQGAQAGPASQEGQIEASGTRAAPFLIPGNTKVLKKRTYSFSVVPKHLPPGQQEPIWFRACLDSTVQGLKRVIREDTRLKLPDETQFIYIRLPNQPVALLDNAARMLSLYGVGRNTRLSLWTDAKAHDEAEPEEDEFAVV